MYDFLVSHVYYNPKVWLGIMCWETSICLNLVCQVQCSWFSIGVLARENLPYIPNQNTKPTNFHSTNYNLMYVLWPPNDGRFVKIEQSSWTKKPT